MYLNGKIVSYITNEAVMMKINENEPAERHPQRRYPLVDRRARGAPPEKRKRRKGPGRRKEMRRPGWAARLAALVLAAVLAGGAAEGAEPFRTVWRGYVIGGPAGALPSEPAVCGASERAEPARRGAPGGSALLYSGGAGHRLGDGARRFGLSHNGAGGGSGDGSISPRRAEE